MEEIMQDYIVQLTLYVAQLRAQTETIRNEVQSGIYEKGSIVEKVNLRMESVISNLEKTLNEIKEIEQNKETEHL